MKEWRNMMRPAVLALTVVLLPSAALSSPSGNEPEAAVAATRRAVSAIEQAPSQQTLRGVVTAVDESDDRITIRLKSGTITNFKVQDGLIFNAVRYGDQVGIIVENIGGARTVIGLTED
jgi:Cu/Ag efflux protein CusF